MDAHRMDAHRIHPHRISLSLLLACCLAAPALGQDVRKPDLQALATDAGAPVRNRNAEPLDDGARRGLHLDARPGDGVLWLPGVELADGTIEVDVRGRNAPGRSFVGVVFHGADDETYEGVYLRPFNFRAEDPQRRAHSVQYIFSPAYPWNVLREAHPGKYEAALDPAPDPEGWVRLRVVLAGPEARVYVDGAERPALVVTRLSEATRGRVGLWVGNDSEGDFADVRITSP